VVLGKPLLTKKAHEKSLTSLEQSLTAGPNCQTGRGNDGAAANLGQAWLLWKGEVKEVSACVVVSGRGEAVLEHRIFCLRAGLSLEVSEVRSEDKMAADL
jgi:hypothetical protein